MPTKRTKRPSNKAHNVKEDMWNWFEAPDNRLRLARFGAAMNGVKNMTPSEAILEGSVMLGSFMHTFSPLKHETGRVAALGESSLSGSLLIVDVGGGVGSQSLVLAKHHPHLRVVVQDREPVVRDAVEVCVLFFTKLPKV